MPGTNGGELELVLALDQQQVGKADPGRTDVDDDHCRRHVGRIVDVGVDQARTGPESSCAQQGFHAQLELEAG